MVLASAALLVVSFQPWSGITYGGGTESTYTAWATARWSSALLLALLAALLLLAYRTRNRRGAAGVAMVMLVFGLGVAAWEWRRPQTPLVTKVEVATIRLAGDPEPTPEQLRRQYEEAIASGGGIVYRKTVRWGFFAGIAAMSVMLVTATGLVRTASEDTAAPNG